MADQAINRLDIQVSRVLPAAIVDLRHRVLRHDQPWESAIFDGDDDLTTIHLGAFERGTLVGCVSLMHRDWEGQPAWQLRGMAVDETMRGLGVGAALLEEVDQVVAASEFSHLIWCNGRLVAKAFYERHGWKIESDLFDIPTAGPHHKMTKRVVFE